MRNALVGLISSFDLLKLVEGPPLRLETGPVRQQTQRVANKYSGSQ